MRRTASTALVAALFSTLVALPGAALAIFDDNVARARIEELRKQVEAMRVALEERVARAEDRRALVELSGQIEALRSEIARLRGQIEVMQNQVEAGDKRGKDLYVDIDTRLRKLEQAKEQAVVASASEKPPADAGLPPGEARAYEAALNQFKLGNYPLAISAFQGFLVTYPASKLAPSAQYWIGNAHFAQRDYKQAMAAQQRVLTAWPDDAKAPDALLNIASSQEQLGDRRGAQRTLETVCARYPASPACDSAKKRFAPPPPAAKK
jgi:tol-pal system protein YbgF